MKKKKEVRNEEKQGGREEGTRTVNPKSLLYFYNTHQEGL